MSCKYVSKSVALGFKKCLILSRSGYYYSLKNLKYQQSISLSLINRLFIASFIPTLCMEI